MDNLQAQHSVNGIQPVYSQPRYASQQSFQAKAPEMKEDGDGKLLKALVCLGAIAAVGFGGYKLAGKINASKLADNAGKGVSNVADDAAKAIKEGAQGIEQAISKSDVNKTAQDLPKAVSNLQKGQRTAEATLAEAVDEAVAKKQEVVKLLNSSNGTYDKLKDGRMLFKLDNGTTVALKNTASLDKITEADISSIQTIVNGSKNRINFVNGETIIRQGLSTENGIKSADRMITNSGNKYVLNNFVKSNKAGNAIAEYASQATYEGGKLKQFAQNYTDGKIGTVVDFAGNGANVKSGFLTNAVDKKGNKLAQEYEGTYTIADGKVTSAKELKPLLNKEGTQIMCGDKAKYSVHSYNYDNTTEKLEKVKK